MSAPILTREQAVQLCQSLPGVYEDYPFDDFNWTVMRHQSNRRIFAAIYAHEGRIWVNLKAEPDYAALLCAAYSCVVPAYHMNKRHWISVILDGTMPQDELSALIRGSYRLTAPRIPSLSKN